MHHFKISHIKTIPPEFESKSIESLEIVHSNLFVLQHLPQSLKRLYICHCSIKKLTQTSLPESLTHLIIVNGHIEYIEENVFPLSLIYLNLSNNLIRQFPACHDNIEYLNLSNNKLETVFIPIQSKKVLLSNNLLDTIPDINNTSIVHLDISDNCIQTIGKLPVSIKYLNVSTNMIDNTICENFNELTNLKHLNISNNVKITHIKLNMNLITLLGSNCMINTLKQLPTTLKCIDVSDNNLVRLDCSNLNHLRHLNISNNKIIGLDCSSSELYYLNISNNKIREVPNIPQFRSVKYFSGSYNPYLNEMTEYSLNKIHHFTEIIKL
jgi:hypothetical protein